MVLFAIPFVRFGSPGTSTVSVSGAVCTAQAGAMNRVQKGDAANVTTETADSTENLRLNLERDAIKNTPASVPGTARIMPSI
jgi:hypothetical protein